jgi:probable rRNA maturation factor
MNIRLTIQRPYLDHAAPQGSQVLPADSDFQAWAEAVAARLTVEGELAIRIVDEAESAALNHQYRHKDGPTNVLSFPSQLAQDMPAEMQAVLAAELDAEPLGDLVICAPVVAAEAQQQGKSLTAHWAHMLVHGLLHLLEYDHVAPDEAQVMEALEIEILGKMGYPDPYAN